MLRFIEGNLLESNADVLVNTVNTVGVMGKGIAVQFKEQFPGNYSSYLKATKSDDLKPGHILVVQDQSLRLGSKTIINVATKLHWRQTSKYSYVESGLIKIREYLEEHKPKSIAIPPLGCGNGGLEWIKVEEMIFRHLSSVKDVEIIVYKPSKSIKEALQRSDIKKKVLSKNKALLLKLLFQYEELGETASLFSANKLAFILQTMGQSLKLNFSKEKYGPYSHPVRHMLYHLNGTYVKGLEQNEIRAFEPLTLVYDRLGDLNNYLESSLSHEEKLRLSKVQKLITGFEGDFSLELLTTVLIIIQERKTDKLEVVLECVANWSDRKRLLFNERHVEIALHHIRESLQEGLLSI